AVAARKFPTKFVYQRTYDERLAHLIEAGKEINPIPPPFEPSGVSAMYGLKYGALPGARATRGGAGNNQGYKPTLERGLRIPLLRLFERSFLGRDQTRYRSFS